ncbi:MAG: Ig-like domain-containing protein [Chloroflexota bacterium]
MNRKVHILVLMIFALIFGWIVASSSQPPSVQAAQATKPARTEQPRPPELQPLVPSPQGQPTGPATKPAVQRTPIPRTTAGPLGAPGTGPDLVPTIPVTTLTVGVNGTMSVVITNSGNQIANASAGTPIVVDITIPANISVQSFTNAACVPAGITGNSGSQTTTCSITTPIGISSNINIGLIQVAANNGAAGTAVFQATIQPFATETDVTNNVVSQNITVNGSPDLTISTNSNPASFITNNPGTFIISASNNGSAASAPGLVIVSSNGNISGTANATITGVSAAQGWSCTNTTTTYSCFNTVSIPAFSSAGGGIYSTIVVTVVPVAVGTVTLDSKVSANEPGSFTGNNNSTLTVNTTGAPDVSINKTGPASFTIGTTGNYDITVINNGTGPTSGVITVTDTLPAGMTLASFSVVPANDFDCSGTIGLQNVSCTKSTQLAPGGGTSTITLTVNVGLTVTSPASNQATVSTFGSPTRTSSAVLTPVTTINMQFTSAASYLAAGKTTFEVDSTSGLDQGYLFTFKNTGTGSTVNPVTLGATLPAGLSFSAISAQTGTLVWDCTASTGTTLSCTTTGALATTATSTLKIKVTVLPPAFPSAAGFTATETNTPNGITTDDTATVAAVAVKGADLTITKTHVDPFIAGATVQYTINVTNNGNAQTYAINNVAPTNQFIVDDLLPAGFTFVGKNAGSAANWGTCTGAPVGAQIKVTCLYTANILPAGVSGSLIIDVVPPAAGVGLVNTATVFSSDDVNNSNNTATNSANVNSPAAPDLAISQTFTPATFTAGQPGVITYTITNQGTAPATGTITLDNVLSGTGPGTFTLNSINVGTSGFTCTPVAPAAPPPAVDVNCTRTTAIPTGTTTYQISINVTPATPGVVTNTATISTNGTPGDSTPANDTSNAQLTINPALVADLQPSQQLVPPGNFITNTTKAIRVTVTNVGGAPTTNNTTSFVDSLPPNFQFVSASDPTFSWGCASSGTAQFGVTVTCTLGAAIPPLAAGASYPPLDINVKPLQAGAGNINSVQVADNSGGETNNANNTSTMSVPVTNTPQPDMAITLTGPTTATVGVDVVYNIKVQNVGSGQTNAADTVTVTSTLDPKFTYKSFTGSGWSCPTTSPNLVCTYTAGSVTPNQTLNQLAVTLTPNTPGSAFYQAVVSGITNDVTAANNTATITPILISGVYDLTITKTHSPSLFIAGAPAGSNTITISIHNNGTLPTPNGANISVTDPLDPKLGTVTITSSGNFACGSSPITTLNCIRITPMGAGETDTITLDAIPPLTPPFPKTVNTTATVSIAPPASEINTSNNTSADSITITNGPKPDLQLTKTLSTSNATSGTFVIGSTGNFYTLTVTNVGAADTATAGYTGNILKVVDTLPPGITYTSAVGTGWTCSSAPPTVTCTTTNSLAINASLSFQINVSVAGPAQTVVNTAQITQGAIGDPNTVNDSANNGQGATTIITTKPPISAGNSTIVATPLTGARANNADMVTVTVTVLDTANQPVAGQTVVVTGAPPTGLTITAVSATTDPSGVATFNVTSTTAGTYVFTATVGGVTISNATGGATATFVTPPAVTPLSAANSSLTVAAPSVPVNGTTTVTVNIKDTNNANVQGAGVILTYTTASGNATGISPASGATGTTDTAGNVTFTFTSSIAQTLTFYSSATLGAQFIALTQHPTLTFFTTTTGVILNSGFSTITVNPTTVAADNTSISTVTVNTRDNNNLPVGGAVVTLNYTTNTGNSTGITPGSGAQQTTDSFGNTAYIFRSSTNQTLTFTATASLNSSSITLNNRPTLIFGTGGTSVTATPGAGTVSASTSTLTTDFISIPADNIAVATLTVTLKDSSSNAVSGKTVTIAGNPTLSGMTLQPASVTTDSSGVAKFTVRSTSLGGPVTFTATDTTDSVTVTQTVQVSFTAIGTKAVASTTGTGNATLTPVPGSPSDGIVITRLLCIRTGPGFGYARFQSPLKFRTAVRVLGRTTRVPGLGPRDGCIKKGGPTWFLIQMADGKTAWANANFIQVGRLNFRALPILVQPGLPDLAGNPSPTTAKLP